MLNVPILITNNLKSLEIVKNKNKSILSNFPYIESFEVFADKILSIKTLNEQAEISVHKSNTGLCGFCNLEFHGFDSPISEVGKARAGLF
jgi:hypothetical protein